MMKINNILKISESGIPYPEKNIVVLSNSNTPMDEILENIGIDYSNTSKKGLTNLYETWLAPITRKGNWNGSETSIEIIKSNDELYICLVITDIDEDDGCLLVHVRNLYPFTEEGLRFALKMQEACQ